MKNLKLIYLIYTFILISLIPSIALSQFEYFTGSWKAFRHQTHMEKLTEDDDGIVKFTESLENTLSDNGRNMLVAYTKMDQMGQQAIQSYNLVKDVEGNITGSDVMNTVHYTGRISGNSDEQVIKLSGYYVSGSGGVFGMELIYKNSETGKVLQMNLELAIDGENPIDRTDIDNIYNGMEIETRPISGDNQNVTYWQVLYFKPDNE